MWLNIGMTTNKILPVSPLRMYQLAALCLCLLAFGFSALVSRTVFERLPHLEDEVAYSFQAQVFAHGDWILPSPAARRAFWQPFIVDNSGSGDSMRFSKYTPGWSLALALGIALGQGWLMNALFAALSVALVYRLGTEIFNPDVGLIAAALLTFSPAALLLNGSLMAHSAALSYTLIFIYACWRMERARVRWPWGLLGGLALGMMLVTRPAPTVAIALPFVAWVLVRILQTLSFRQAIGQRVAAVTRFAAPYVLLAVVTLSFQTITSAYNAAATGSAGTNLYTLVWSYDRIGFGTCCGRSGHNLEKAFRHARFDMSLAAADLFGWQINGWSGQALPDELRTFLLTDASYWQPIGLSFLLLPFGIVIGLLWLGTRQTWPRRLLWLGLWLMGAVAWCVLPVTRFPPALLTSPASAWLWLALGLLWLLLPLLVVIRVPSPQVRYTWLLVAATGCLIVLQMGYWVGSQRYSTRYWYEAIGAVCILSALPLATLMRGRRTRLLIYGGLALALLYSYTNYSVPRVSVLYQFNNVARARLADLDTHREDDRPVLLLVYGDATGDNRVSWRAYSSFIAVTDPFLTSDIVAARIGPTDETLREQVLAMFPDRQLIEIQASGTDATFVK